MLTSSQRETREFNYQRHGLICNFARLTVEQATRAKQVFAHHFDENLDDTCSGVNFFVGGLLLTVNAPSQDHNFIVVDEPCREAKELFAETERFANSNLR